MRAWVLLIVVSLILGCSETAPPAEKPLLPWNINVGEDGETEVFGITIGKTQFADAEKELGSRYTLALFGSEAGVPQLEAYFREVALGGLTGRMVLSLTLPEDDLQAMRGRSPEDRVQIEGNDRRWEVADEDLTLARQGIISVIGYVPAVDLEPEVIELRFGVPAERISMVDGSEHWLYPGRGLDIVVNREGREFLQYVVPAEFERLRAPLEPAEAN